MTLGHNTSHILKVLQLILSVRINYHNSMCKVKVCVTLLARKVTAQPQRAHYTIDGN